MVAIHYFIVPLLAILAATLSISITSAEELTTGNPLPMCEKAYGCANCTAVRVCRPDPNGSGEFIDYNDVNCTGVKPFCDQNTGSCTENSSEECTTKVIGEHVCMKNGVFPHPTSCKKYFKCENYTSTSFKCFSNDYYHNYDANLEECRHYSGCNVVSCYGHNGFKKVLQLNNRFTQFFAYCINGEAAVMDKCDGKYVLNETTQMCEAFCSYPGLIEDITDCRKFYKCDPTSPALTAYKKTSFTCPAGYGFSQESYQCVPLESIPWCKQLIVTTLSTIS